MNRRRFLGGLLAAAGLAKAGALGAEEGYRVRFNSSSARGTEDLWASPRDGDLWYGLGDVLTYRSGRWVPLETV